jgi:hypothetical protein
MDERGQGRLPQPSAPAPAARPLLSLGSASIICACLVVVVPVLGFALPEAMGTYARPIGRMSELLVKAGPVFWLAGLGLGIAAMLRGDRRRGIAGIVICSVELGLVALGIGTLFVMFSIYGFSG